MRTILTHLSHELNRPLAAMRAGLDRLLAENPAPVCGEQSRHLDRMVGLCDSMLELTRDYIDYAFLIQDGQPPHFGQHTLAALMHDVGQELAPKAAARGLSWECALDGPDATVTTDLARCRQLIGNLAGNAIKFTPAGGSVRVSLLWCGPPGLLHSARNEGAFWQITIVDSGPGIPANELSHVFEPFYRIQRADGPHLEGNGLGLAICREIVRQLGGQIQIAPEPGGGTRVTVRLPADPGRCDTGG